MGHVLRWVVVGMYAAMALGGVGCLAADRLKRWRGHVGRARRVVALFWCVALWGLAGDSRELPGLLSAPPLVADVFATVAALFFLAGCVVRVMATRRAEVRPGG